MDGRTPTEVIVKTIALHIAVVASAGHLMSLQRMSTKSTRRIVRYFLWFLIVPTFPFAELADRFIRCARVLHGSLRARSSVDVSYCLGGLLGVHAELRPLPGIEQCASVPLFDVPIKDLRKVPQDRGWLWIGRYTVLLCLMAQSAATLVLSGRRLKADALSEVDVRNASVALGGVVVQIMSTCILLMNQRWEYEPSPTEAAMISVVADDKQPLSATTRLIVTTFILLNSWYFRFHIRDTYLLAIHTELNSYYNPVYPLSALATDVYQRSDTAKSLLPNFVWLAWPMMIYIVLENNEPLAFTISAVLSMSFPIEELAKGGMSKWKDPLSDALYVF